jgi:hypothetical protein
MKFRTYFQKKLISGVVVLPIGFGLIVIEGMLHTRESSVLQIATFIGMGALFIYRHKVKCPNCRKGITFLGSLSDARYFQLSRSVHFCPYCGNTLECEVDENTGEILSSMR